ncbi:SpoIIE family protein phosphatase [Niallia sp. Man26]|uniref:SpoIIE family protein phosphatase n=1 Tax=Niallia sp. Man26 TaxID=2912824 RepID=UPI001EDABD68|nr:SpoIIE family protein phosphatase [Niallia sp. Man26]UPO87294.1 SpoIIE family protein phosphatase [Niallia sp. Man26]
MDRQLDEAPCGFLMLSDNGNILSVNRTLLELLGFDRHDLINKHMNQLLTKPSRIFCQLYFFPLIRHENKIEEMHFSLQKKGGEEIPALIFANRHKKEGVFVIECVLVPMHQRLEFESEILKARNIAAAALKEAAETNKELENVLCELQAKQKELIKLNKQKEQYQERIKRELDLAKNIQGISLSTPFSNEEISISAYYQSSNELSGDMYSFYQISPGKYGFIILDVMGHGISSALISMSLRSLFQLLIMKGATAEEIMAELDTQLHLLFRNGDGIKHYCTAIFLTIDTNTKEIEYINAGHPPALWIGRDTEITEFKSTIPPIGIFEDLTFRKSSFAYQEGGRLFLYTDGVTEAISANTLNLLVKEQEPIHAIKEKIVHFLKLDEEIGIKVDDRCFLLIEV